MAKKRMFHINIINSDEFIDMPLSAQALYMHLNMNADDEGFINSPKRIQRYIGASDDDVKILIAKGFIIPFESGVVVVTHWKQHNTIQSDRFTETLCIDEKSMLSVNNKKEYFVGNSIDEIDCKQNGNILETNSIQNGNADKISLDKNSIGENSINNSCSSNGCEYTEIWKSLTTADIEELNEIYYDADELITQVARDVAKKHKIVKTDVKNYIIGYADNVNWETNEEHELLEREVQ